MFERSKLSLQPQNGLKAFVDHYIVLSEYAAMACVACTGDMIKLVTERGIDTIIPILAEVKKSCVPPTSPSSLITQVELSKVSLATGKDQEVKSQ